MEIKRLPQTFEVEQGGGKLYVAQKKDGKYSLVLYCKKGKQIALKNRKREDLIASDGELTKIIELLKSVQLLLTCNPDF